MGWFRCHIWAYSSMYHFSLSDMSIPTIPPTELSVCQALEGWDHSTHQDGDGKITLWRVGSPPSGRQKAASLSQDGTTPVGLQPWHRRPWSHSTNSHQCWEVVRCSPWKTAIPFDGIQEWRLQVNGGRIHPSWKCAKVMESWKKLSMDILTGLRIEIHATITNHQNSVFVYS